jgi:integrase
MPLRQRMIDDMAIRNMSPLTQKAYVRAVKNFSLYFRRSPDVLTFEDVRAYQLHQVSRGLEATTFNQVMCALRFLYGTTLGKKDVSEEIKLARQSDPLPVVLSRDEVAPFLKAAPDLRWRTALVTIYAGGLRGILFKAAAEALTTIAADPKHLGAWIGLTAVLHTWGQNLDHHPHVHRIVPGGGVSIDS